MLQSKSTKDNHRRSAVINKNKDEKNNSNSVPNHRHKRLFMLQNSYISESEGFLLNHSNKDLDITNTMTSPKKPAKSNMIMHMQSASAKKALKSTTD